MPSLSYLLLRLLHIVHSLCILFSSFWQRLVKSPPLPLTAARRRIPKHLAVLFTKSSYIEPDAEEERLLSTVETVIAWARLVGIEQVSFYDRAGTLLSCADSIRDIVYPNHNSPQHKPIAQHTPFFPLTPPSSTAPSRPLTPCSSDDEEPFFITINAKEGKDNELWTGPKPRSKQVAKPTDALLSLYLLSARSAKELVASVANDLRRAHKQRSSKRFDLTVGELASHLEGPEGISNPDFVIVYPLSTSTYHRIPLEMDGFPPWHMKLTEIYLNRYRKRHRWWLFRLFNSQRRTSKLSLPLTEVEFREALDQFAGAEMRFGK